MKTEKSDTNLAQIKYLILMEMAYITQLLQTFKTYHLIAIFPSLLMVLFVIKIEMVAFLLKH